MEVPITRVNRFAYRMHCGEGIQEEPVRYNGSLDYGNCYGNGEKETDKECNFEVEPSGLAGRWKMKI